MKKSFQEAEKRGNTPYKHDLGQNFLYDQALLTHLVEQTGLTQDDDVLEIGPGAGTLTECLCRAGGNVVSVEVDHDLVPVLKLMEERYPRLRIVEGDIRRVDFEQTAASLRKPFFVIANIPYNITSPILDLLFEKLGSIRRIALMVQKEVAEKLTAAPGDDLYGILSVRARYLTEPFLVEIVPAACFTPSPKVDSAFILLDVPEKPLYAARDENHLFSLVKAGFGLRRKTLANALKGTPDGANVPEALARLGLSPTVRGEALDVADWARLSDCLLEMRG